jgi:TfoX/Sxy family transcriptional regulator of competence genes
MSKASPEVIKMLEDVLNQSALDLKKVSSKKMFGCHALWANGNIFALVWKEGRIGFKLPDEVFYQKLLGASGADAWMIGPKQMSHWVFVPEAFHSKKVQLKKWAELSYGLCETLVPKKAVTKKKASIKAKKVRGKKKKA